MQQFLVMVAVTVTALSVRAAEKPNIIMILADDMGYADCGFNGRNRDQDAEPRQARTPRGDSRCVLRAAGLLADAIFVHDRTLPDADGTARRCDSPMGQRTAYRWKSRPLPMG